MSGGNRISGASDFTEEASAEPDPPFPIHDRVRLGAARRPILGAMDGKTRLGDFLQTRRSQLRPEDIGVPTYGERRVSRGFGARSWHCWRG
ncbi:hypothetical protein SGLAM104S_05423 [Streptomyces glaucescens]